MAAVADDTGLEVEALGGAPGVYSARYSGKHATYADNVKKLLDELYRVGADAPGQPDGQIPDRRPGRLSRRPRSVG